MIRDFGDLRKGLRNSSLEPHNGVTPNSQVVEMIQWNWPGRDDCKPATSSAPDIPQSPWLVASISWLASLALSGGHVDRHILVGEQWASLRRLCAALRTLFR